MTSISVSTAFIGLLFFYIVKRVIILFQRPSQPYPPGPKPKPVIGNLLDFPMLTPSKVYIEWGKKYNSDILYAEALGNRVVVLNRLEDALELFENHSRARMYSDRPTIPIVEVMGWNCNSALMPYGDEWRHHRRASQQILSIKATADYEPIQRRKIRQMLFGLLNAPEDFNTHNKMLSVSLMISLMYGYEVESIQDPVVQIADESIVLGTQLLIPGGSLINLIPALKYIPPWFPGAASRKQAAKVRSLTDDIKRIPMEFVKQSFKDGTVVPSLVTNFYEKMYTTGASQEEEEVVQGVAYTVYGAASDTTISATKSFFYAMALHPEVQKRAQAEIESVIGSRRLPTLDDRKSLPYVEAIYRELMRTAPPLPTGVPHSVIDDDIYKGYFIPKGTTVLPNIWAMNHDEEKYPDPYSFKPERFLDSNGSLNDDSRILAYGFGRRICVGRHLASSTMWLIIASVLSCYTIERPKDTNGREIEMNDEFVDSGIIRFKGDFKCLFLIRSPEARNLFLDNV